MDTLSLSKASLTGFAVRVAGVEGVNGGGSSAIVRWKLPSKTISSRFTSCKKLTLTGQALLLAKAAVGVVWYEKSSSWGAKGGFRNGSTFTLAPDLEVFGAPSRKYPALELVRGINFLEHNLFYQRLRTSRVMASLASVGR